MSIRRITVSLVALAAAVVIPLAAAAPAQAGVNPGLITLALDGNGKCVASATSITGNPGSAFTVHNDNCSDPRFKYVIVGTVNPPGPLVGPGVRLPNNTSATFTLSSMSGTIGALFAIGGLVVISVTVTDVPIEDPKPHDYFQQVGVPESGDCADVDPAVGHYPGYPIGGWSKSWAQWINDGNGGAVCTREIEERVNGDIVLVD